MSNYVKIKNGFYTIKDPEDYNKILFYKRYKFFQDFKKYGFKSKSQFITAFLTKQLSQDLMNQLKEVERAEDTAKNRKEAYKEKKRKEKEQAIRKELAKLNPFIISNEKIEIEIAKKLDNKIHWKFISTISSLEKEHLKDCLKLSKGDMETSLKRIKIKKQIFSITEFYEIMGKTDLQIFFKVYEYKFNVCPFFDNHKSILVWNNESKKYFILTFDLKSLEGYVLDFVNLLELYEIDITNIAELIGTRLMPIERYKKLVSKYDEFLIELDDEEFPAKYPYLYNYLKSYLWFLKVLVRIGKQYSEKIYYLRIDKRPIFFMPLKTIENYLIENNLKQINYQKISKLINVFCTIGFFNKVMGYEVPRALKYDTHKGYDTNYLQLADIDFALFEERARQLVIKKVDIKKFKKAHVISIFGEKLADSVFQRKKIKKIQEDDNSDNELPF